jgi:hypothetical protein
VLDSGIWQASCSLQALRRFVYFNATNAGKRIYVKNIMNKRWIGISCLCAIVLAGCVTSANVSVRPSFERYDRVAILTKLTREQEELFLPMYMAAFPDQILVERRDVEAIIGEQDILPDRLDETSRAKIRKILGVKAIIYPNASGRQLSIKVIDTETGEISASVVVLGSNIWDSTQPVPAQQMIAKAVNALKTRTPLAKR